MDNVLYCNYKRCHAPLTTNAWLTTCSHIFCSDHFPSPPASTRKCPCCSKDLQGKNDVYQMNLKPPETFKSLALAGYCPSNIIGIGYKALHFLNFQWFQEKMFMQSYIKHQRLKLAQSEVQLTQVETSHQTTIDKLKGLIQQQTQECENLQRDLNTYIRKSQFLEEKVKSKNRQLHKMLMKCDLKRQYSHHSDQVEQPRNTSRCASPNYENLKETSSPYPMFCSQQLPMPSSRMNDSFHRVNYVRSNRSDNGKISFSQNY